MRPSSDVASFSVIIGRCCVTRRRKPRLISAASSRQTGIATSMPAFLQACNAASGDARVRILHRDDYASMPASSRAVLHGPVTPSWSQGSSVT